MERLQGVKAEELLIEPAMLSSWAAVALVHDKPLPRVICHQE